MALDGASRSEAWWVSTGAVACGRTWAHSSLPEGAQATGRCRKARGRWGTYRCGAEEETRRRKRGSYEGNTGRWERCLSQPLPVVEQVPQTDALSHDAALLLSIPLPRSRLEKLADGQKSENRSALLGAYTRQGLGVCRHTSQARYHEVLAAAHRIAS
eukprot:6467255-Amphidinium_carterae.1